MRQGSGGWEHVVLSPPLTANTTSDGCLLARDAVAILSSPLLASYGAGLVACRIGVTPAARAAVQFAYLTTLLGATGVGVGEETRRDRGGQQPDVRP